MPKSGIFHVFNPLKNQNQRYEARVGFPGYEARVGFPAPYQGDFKKQCVSPKVVS